MPIEEPGTTIRRFGDSFVYGRFDGAGSGKVFAAVLHVGEVGQLFGGGESGFGGGQLASLWTEEGGPTLLARRKGRSSGDPSKNDDWAQWRTFPVHAITLRTKTGRVASTILDHDPGAAISPLAVAPLPGQIGDALAGYGAWSSPATVPEDQASAVLATVKGEIPAIGYGELSGLGPSLLADVRYRRSFLMADGGIWVRSTLGGTHPGEKLTDAWETVPVWNRDTSIQGSLLDTTIILHSAQLGPVDASHGSGGRVPDVDLVEIVRGGETTWIHFDHKRDAMVGATWRLDHQESHTLLVDRLPASCDVTAGCAPVASETFEYFVEAAT